jgi:hypothetical protein
MNSYFKDVHPSINDFLCNVYNTNIELELPVYSRIMYGALGRGIGVLALALCIKIWVIEVVYILCFFRYSSLQWSLWL